MNYSVFMCLIFQCYSRYSQRKLTSLACLSCEQTFINVVVEFSVFRERELTLTRSLYAVARPSVVGLSSVCRLSSVTLVHPTQAVVMFGNISKAFGTLAIQ